MLKNLRKKTIWRCIFLKLGKKLSIFLALLTAVSALLSLSSFGLAVHGGGGTP